MPKFDSKYIGGEIAYDFSDWGGSSGTVPEPSKFMVKKFMKDVNQIFVDLKLKEQPEDPDDMSMVSSNELVNIMNDIDQEEIFQKLTDGLCECIAILCGGKKTVTESMEGKSKGEMPNITESWTGGSPSYDQLVALPYRPFMGFFGYLMENVFDPQSSRPDTNTSPARLRSV